MKLRIKQVPDTKPNADGEWVELNVTPLDIVVLEDGKGVFDRLTAYCDEGFHAVSYEVDRQNQTRDSGAKVND